MPFYKLQGKIPINMLLLLAGMHTKKKENIRNNKFPWLVGVLKARNEITYMKLCRVWDKKHPYYSSLVWLMV